MTNTKDSVSSETKLCPHGSVGAIIKKGESYLCLYRNVFPRGIALVAGHLDDGENPEKALVREVREEVGIEVKKKERIFQKTLNNPCKRGFTSHEWWVFNCFEWVGEPKRMESDKHEFVKFMGIEEIKSYANRGDIDPAWLTILKDLAII